MNNKLSKWGLGIGDWGLGIGDWPIPNPQSPNEIYRKMPPIILRAYIINSTLVILVLFETK